MAEFPRYYSKGQLTTQQPSVQAAADTQGQILEKASEIGKSVQDNSLKWTNAVDTIQKTTATANFKSGIIDIENRAQNDPDYNNSDQYFKEINKLKTDSVKGFASKLAESQTAIDLGYEAKVSQIKIQNLYKKKMIDVGQASTLKLLDIESQNQAPDLENRIGKILNTQIQAGIIDHKSAYTLQKEYVKKGKYNSFLSDLNGNPALAEANLSQNTYGFDITELEKAKNIYNTESKKIQATTENDVLGAYLNGEDIPPDSIRKLMDEKKVDAKFAESMIDKLNNPKPDVLSKDEAYIEFQNKGADALAKGDKASIEEVISLMTDTMQAHSRGLLDKSDVDRILKDRNELVQKKLEPVAEDIMNKAQPKTLLQRLSFWSDEYANKKPEIKARMYRALIDGIKQGKSNDLLMKKIIDNEINIQMSDNLLKPNRQYATNPDTKQRLYSDDGGATWFDEKTDKEIK